MMIFNGLVLVIVVLCIICSLSSGSGIVSSNPIRLSLQRFKRQGDLTSLTPDFQTSTSFFKEALNLVPGRPFHIDIERWDDVVNCGLFANLSAITEEVEDGICLNITGIELGSTKVSPSVTLTASTDSPKPSGSIFFSESNFRGIGENLELSATFKPDLNDSKMALQPNLKIRWSDCVVGRLGRLSVEAFHQDSLEYMVNVVRGARNLPLWGASRRIFTRILGGSVNILRYFTLPAWEGISTRAMGRCGLEPYCKVVSPMEIFAGGNHSGISSDSLGRNESTVLVGVKASADVQFVRGLTLSAWHDGGYSRYEGSGHLSEYHQTGFTARSPTFQYPYPLVVRRPVKVSENCTSQDRTETALLFNGAIAAHMKLSGMRSWGAGSLPLYHGESLHSRSGDKVRGFPHSPDRAGNTIDSYIMLKSDLYYDTQSKFGKWGVFADNALYVHSGSTEEERNHPRGISTVGLSWRGFGFKIAVGNPLDKLSSTPRIHIGLDQE